MVTSVQNKLSNSVLSSYSYSYFLDGNQKSKTDHNNLTTTYQYDNLGRLISEAEGNILFKEYSYDQYSNRSSLTVSGSENYAVDYVYDLNNRLTLEEKIEGSTYTTSSYFYDHNGNLFSKTSETLAPSSSSSSVSFEGTGTEFYSYNSFNQLIRINIDNDLISYDYRPDGLRYSKTIDNDTITHLWNGSSMVADIFNDQGSITYLRGIGLISFNDGADTTFYLFNAHGDVIQLTDDLGTLTRSYDYDSFGIEKNPDPQDLNFFRYSGYYFDLETGTYYLQARYYDPSLGRFLAEDPAFDGLNWYTYCANSPLLYVDPSGTVFWFVPILIAFAIGAVVGVGVVYVSDVIDNISNGETGWDILKPTSSWETYTGAALGGGVAGVVTMFAGPIVGGAVFGGVSTLAGQSLEKFTGTNDRPWEEILFDTVVNTTIGAVTVGAGKILGQTAAKFISKIGSKTPVKTTAVKGPGGGGSSFTAIKEGEFSISNWNQYPSNLPKPNGPFRLIEGIEYNMARSTANNANQTLHRTNPLLKGLHIHEIHPVKFGGSPTDINNKIFLSPTEHFKATAWWNKIRNQINRK